MVLFSHNFALLRMREPRIPGWDTLGFVAVAIFFSISGYFMPGSFVRSGNFMGFIRRRLRRLLPGMVACSFLITYVLGAIYTSQPLFEYLTSRQAAQNFAMWSVFLAQPMPAVFPDFIVPGAINGSLWTLSIEFLCYVVLGAALSFTTSWRIVLALFIGSIIGTAWLVHTGTGFSFYGVPLNYLFMFGICFTGGALLSMTETAWLPARLHLVVFAALSIWLLRGRFEIFVLGTLGITLITIIIGASFSEKLINGRFDISYGVYIYAFPIQQLVINLLTQKLWLSMAISAALTVLAGHLSYRFVERPFLQKRSKHTYAAGGAHGATLSS